MGCDIHDIVQVQNESGEWETVINDFLGGQYYGLFAVIGDVRNYYDIPPIASYRGIPADIENQIAQTEKELIASDAISAWHSYDKAQEIVLGDAAYGDHSHSWVTLRELLDYDWEKKVEVNTVIKYDPDYLEWDKINYPNVWSSSSIAGTEQWGKDKGKRIETIDMRSIPEVLNPDLSYYIRIYYMSSVRDLAWVDEAMDKLKSLSDDPEKVRWVFSFDS